MYILCPLCKKITYPKHILSDYTYNHCPNCITLFIAPFPKKEKLDTYYKKNFVYTAGSVNEKVIRKRAKIILQKLTRLNPFGKTLLDIGSGYGYFLDEGKKIGLNPIGIEPSKTLVQISRMNYKTSIYSNTLEEFIKNNKEKRFDFITLIQVIEHVVDPKATLQMVCGLLSKNGILYIETPNLDSHLYRAENDKYTFLTPPDHLWVFSKKSFVKIIPKNFTIDKISTYSYPEHFMGIIKALLKANSNQHTKTVTTVQYQPRRLTVALHGRLKYIFFDKFIAHLFYPLLNLHYYGSIFELCIKKK